MKQNPEKRSKSNLLIILLLVVSAVAICVAVWALFFRQTGPVLAPDYAPIEEEPLAETIPGDSGEKLNEPEGGSSVSLTYSRNVAINLTAETAELYFANPSKSNQDMVLQVAVHGSVIIQSGTLKPGTQVTTLPLLEGMSRKLSAGVYEGNFVVLYYHPETGEKAIVNTEIPVTITVSS